MGIKPLKMRSDALRPKNGLRYGERKRNAIRANSRASYGAICDKVPLYFERMMEVLEVSYPYSTSFNQLQQTTTKCNDNQPTSINYNILQQRKTPFRHAQQ
jgi:hypothetical protein